MTICCALLALVSGEIFAADCANCNLLQQVRSSSLVTRYLFEFSCALSHPSASDVEKIIKAALQPSVRTLNRRVDFYNWNTSDPDPSESADHYFRQCTTPRAGASLGEIYTAPDPLVSIDYSGHQHGKLLQISVPAGTRYLDNGQTNNRGLFKLSPDAAAQLKCYLQAHGSSHEKDIDLAKPMLSTASFSNLLPGIYRELGIEFTIDGFRKSSFGDCANSAADSEVVFHDPLFSSKIEATILSRNPQPAPSRETLKRYQNVLRYFDAYDFSSNDTGSSRGAYFWDYYRAWAPLVYHLPPGTDLVAFQKKNSAKMKRNRKTLVSGLFGCSSDPQFGDEVPSSSLRNGKPTQNP